MQTISYIYAGEEYKNGIKQLLFFLFPTSLHLSLFLFLKPDGRGDVPPLTPSLPGDFTLDLN